MKQTELIEAFRTATATAPAAAKQRVWRRLDNPAPKAAARWPFALVGTALVAAALAAVFVNTRPPPPPLKGNGFIALAKDASLSGKVLTLNSGTALVSSWGGKIDVTAGRHHVTTDAALFAVQIAGENIRVSVRDGAVLVDGERVTAAGPEVDFAPLRAIEPSDAQTERDWSLAEGAEVDGRIDEALSRFAALAQASSLRAEAALLRKAQLELWRQHRPDAALLTLAQAEARFPNGALQQEAALFALEALVAQQDWPAAATRAQDFLARFPDSERRAEVERVAAGARSFER